MKRKHPGDKQSVSLKGLLAKSFLWFHPPFMLSEREFFSRWATELEGLKTRNRNMRKKWRSNNLDYSRTYHREYARRARLENPLVHRKNNKRSYAKFAERRREDARRQRVLLKQDPCKHAASREKARLRKIARRKTDPMYRISTSLRTRMWMAIHKHKGTKACKSLELLGCSLKLFRSHIESQFTAGMTWANYGFRGWHVDHIKPIASFDLTDKEQQKACFHYTNCRPMWWADNLSKGAKLEMGFVPRYKCGTGTAFQRVT